ncbi:MAG TPA: transcriptional regulator MraZ [Chlorobaculum parvum]|uniref:Transcriptional regulator MraZ n=1 Tax=Chlorobaculum parvum TaxID=274539 RepID=A0A7C5DKX2_9CHLB|nr:transcriptional regulator MraZ [Chlorobaculum parvum]
MPGFIGREQHTVDDKGRLLIPARFRRKFLRQKDELGADRAKQHEVLYVFKADDGSLELYEPAVWNEKEYQLLKLSDFNPEERLLTTMIYARLDQLELDRSGRIAFSREMLDHAGIDREAVVIGANAKMVVWNPDRLTQLLADNAGSFSELANRYVKGDGKSGVS